MAPLVSRTIWTLVGSSLAVVPAIIVFLTGFALIAIPFGAESDVFGELSGMVVLLSFLVAFPVVFVFGYPVHWTLRRAGFRSGLAYSTSGALLGGFIGFFAFTKLVHSGPIILNGPNLLYGSMFAFCGGVVGYVFRQIVYGDSNHDDRDGDKAA